ncbi:hypothetical protein ASA1KI_21580 [Opitutales bacterium ASA1]|uniref:hypothetical protein n=1 Tax=Congregicoccus parvus TaxID=3081749 RepID=UPI002B2AA789|nr:hypothetical protein ASA1KI_21580 [Opitutales bacterium ASA1]
MNTSNTSSCGIRYTGLSIETAPMVPMNELPSQVREYAMRRSEMSRASGFTMDYSKFASLNPAFGRIVCLTVGQTIGMDPARPRIVTRSFVGDERSLLLEFSACFCGNSTVWVHYDGLSFDVPFILSRMRWLGIECSISRFGDTRRFQQDPHCDVREILSNWDHSRSIPLEVAALQAGLPSPKPKMHDPKVAARFLAGEIETIARHRERAVATAINLHRRLILNKPAVNPERCFWRSPSNIPCRIDFGEQQECDLLTSEDHLNAAWEESARLGSPRIASEPCFGEREWDFANLGAD